MPGGALEGIRVIELGQLVSAPYCAKLFADYGADVIKIELPRTGDIARQWGPFPHDQPDAEKSGLFCFLNTNKRGITLDVSHPRARDLLFRLVETADVLIENNHPKQMRDWGLHYGALSEVNPKLVMISITPFGQTGPYSNWIGYDLNAFHLSAAGSRYCGRPDAAPLEHGTFAADFFGATAAAAWGLAALYGRQHVGSGQHVDVSCAEVIAAVFVGSQNIGGYAQDRVFDRRTGVGMSLGAPATILPCKDGHVWILALEAAQWNALARVMGNPEWMQLDMFQEMFVRAQNADAMYPLIEQWTMEHTKAEIMEQCQAAGCPVTAVFTVAEAAEHPHLKERGYIVELQHPALGRIRDLGAPFKLPESPGGPRQPAPRLGQHSAEVYRTLPGVTADELVILQQEGVIGEIEHSRRRARHSTPAIRQSMVATPRFTGHGPALGSPQPTGFPLHGIRVANFGWVWAGPVVGQTLGFLGAEVYKIESRARIDLTRMLPPFGGGVRDPDRSLSNHAGWAGNGSITLNLKTPEARELARRLITTCDVVVENFGPGAMNELELSYDTLRGVKPDIIMLSMPAAGLSGPLKNVRTYGLSLSSITGLDSVTGYFGGPPVPFENAFADPYNGIMGAFAILVALTHRDRTGKGQHIDYSQQEAVMQMVGPAFMDYVLNGRVAQPIGNRHPLRAAAPHGVFPCAGEDRWISIVVTNEHEWRGLLTSMGSPEWACAPLFASHAHRVQHIDEIHEHMAEWTRRFNDYELAERLQHHGVAAAPVLNVADLYHDPHYRARRTFIEIPHPLGFTETIYGAYVKTSRTEVRVRPGPRIGQDNDFVFLELLGLPEVQYRQLIREQVIY
jgi:benzylsuccinate CoA-transferase BbsF subunit